MNFVQPCWHHTLVVLPVEFWGPNVQLLMVGVVKEGATILSPFVDQETLAASLVQCLDTQAVGDPQNHARRPYYPGPENYYCKSPGCSL